MVELIPVLRPAVPHGVRRRGSGSVQPEVPLLPEQPDQRGLPLLLHCKTSVCWRTCVPACAPPVRTAPRPPQAEVTEKNPGGYLSATEIPLSRLYIGMAAVFFTAAMIWVYTLMKHRYGLAPWPVWRAVVARLNAK